MTFSFSVAADIAINEACPVPTGICSTCQRSGLPILPLRAAYAPEPWYTQALPLNRGAEVKAVRLRADQPRTLRSGYLYVLLDNREWQAYEISPEGALRQFPPYQIPREEPRSLCEICIQQDHDIPASFINIKTDRYSTAWLALANDPWSERVLNGYLRGGVVDGMALEDRFYKLDLKTARNDPASIGIAMTEADLQMHQVLEYAQPMAGDFQSVHGFYPRNSRLRALAGHVREVTEEHKLANGVLALVLPDPIGMVQELNAQRLLRYQAMQKWRAEPTRSFEFLTSQVLLGIRKVQVQRAEERAIKDAEEAVEQRGKWNDSVLGVRNTLPSLDLETEKTRRTAAEQADALERLGDRYDEKTREDFEDRYNKTLAAWQSIIDDVAEPYASHYHGAAFQLAALNDYSVTSTESVKAYILMTRTCLAGGPTERSADGTLGPTGRLWKKELENRNSLYYQAMMAKDKSLLEQLTDELLADERTRVYHSIKTLIATDQGQRLMVEPVQTAIGELLAAAATASYAVGNQLSEHAKALVGHLHREAMLRFSGVHITQITISLKVGEYLTLLNEVLYEGTERVIAQLDQQFRKPAERKVRAMLLGKSFTPALASSHATLIEVKVWTLESAEALQARLDKLRVGLGDGVGDALRNVSIGTTALKGSMDDLARHMSLNAEVALLLARDSMHSMRNAGKAAVPGGIGMGLALGSLWFQQDALRRSYENMLNTVGDGDAEAAAAVMSASVGVMGAGVEVVGMTVQILRPGLTTEVIRATGEVQKIGLGVRIVQFGGAIVALASVVEGVQYVLAAGRAGKAGDKTARNVYGVAAVAAVFSAGVGISGSLAPAAVALLPLGIAVLLGLAAYSLAVWAKRLESEPLEMWARHSLWGIPEKHRRWTTSKDMDTAIGVLNAVLLGLTADAAMKVKAEQNTGLPIGDAVPAGLFLDYKIVLPGYAVDASRYEWALEVYRPGQSSGETIASGRTGGMNGALPPPVSWKRPGYHPETTAPLISHDAESETLEISGLISFFGNLEVHALQLEVSYWPDKSDEAGVARLIVKEDKIGEWKGWGSV